MCHGVHAFATNGRSLLLLLPLSNGVGCSSAVLWVCLGLFSFISSLLSRTHPLSPRMIILSNALRLDAIVSNRFHKLKWHLGYSPLSRSPSSPSVSLSVSPPDVLRDERCAYSLRFFVSPSRRGFHKVGMSSSIRGSAPGSRALQRG